MINDESSPFEPFDLTTYLGPDAIPWISASSRVGSVHGIPRQSVSLPALTTLLDMVHDYTDDIHFAEPQPNPELSQVLGELVFGDPAVSQLFQATRGVASDRGRQILFRILPSPHLSVLPWELLPDPAAGRNNQSPYLALAPDTHLVRQARGRTYPMRTSLLEAPLNLLLVLSSPIPETEREDWLPFDIFEVKRNLLSELAGLERAGLLNVDVEDRPTTDNLRRRIGAQRRGYHIFHYVGHAFPEGLILEDRAGYRDDLTAAKLVELLRLCPDLRLTVFAGCETARSATDPSTVDTRKSVGWRDILSLADYCVQEACPAVIGMQAVLPFTTERIFTRFFYQALASGYSTAQSLNLARGAIQSDQRVGGDLLDWSVPSLFVGSDEPGALVPRTSAAPATSPRARAELNLGLLQRSQRFFGRDLPLRQAVDVMIGRTTERVLVVTGASGIGKTSLVDRALEEVGNAASHALFVSFDRLAPEVEQACNLVIMGQAPDAQRLSEIKVDESLEKLCRFTNEVLSSGGVSTRVRDANWKAAEWWERLVEDLVRRNFVLVIDGVGSLDFLQRALLEQVIEGALADYLENYVKRKTKISVKDALAAQLSRLEKGKTDKATLLKVWKENRISDDVINGVATLSDRHALSSVYIKALEQQISILSRQATTPATSTSKVKYDAVKTKSHIIALSRLDEIRSSMGGALGVLADRRSPARIIVTTAAGLQDFFNVPDNLVFEMRLAPLTWAETWRWIRRNLPGLVRFGEDYLARLWVRFGVQIEHWEELERLVLKRRSQTIDLIELAQKIVPAAVARTAVNADQATQRGHRALRIAVAGPFLAGPNELAEAITQLAREHGVGGRVVFNANDAGALATLINEPSPFKNMQADPSVILSWLDRVIAQQPDIILLDYGAMVPLKDVEKEDNPERNLFRSIHQRVLLIAAGGHKVPSGKGAVWVPSVYPEVLSVGALDDEGELRDYSSWYPHLTKPDLFMKDNLSSTPLAITRKPLEVTQGAIEVSTWGSGFAALHAVATAVLVWSLHPDLSPHEIRRMLVKAGRPIRGTKKARALTIESAITMARRKLIERTLQDGPASLQTLSAITGLEGRALSTILDPMVEEGRAVRLATGRLERFQLVR